MPIKNCKYCGYRMTKIVYGMATPDDLEKENEFLQFAGCIIDFPAKAYVCRKCESSILSQASPTVGACLNELPTRQREAISIFVDRIARAINPMDPAVSAISCSLVSGGEWPDPESPLLHLTQGDVVTVSQCHCTQVIIPLESETAIIRQATGIRVLQEKHVPLGRPFSDVDIVDLVVGNRLLLPIIETLVEVGCAMEFCHRYPWLIVESKKALSGEPCYEQAQRTQHRSFELTVPESLER